MLGIKLTDPYNFDQIYMIHIFIWLDLVVAIQKLLFVSIAILVMPHKKDQGNREYRHKL